MRRLSLRRPAVVVGAVAAAMLVADAVVLAAFWSQSVAPAEGAGVVTTGFPHGADEPGIFTDSCRRTQTAPNDPILMPGMTGKSMQHDFFGAPAVTASTTAADLVGGASGCTTSADASAYWTPVLSQHGVPLQPTSTLLYWRTGAGQSGSTQPMPPGITLIAGDEDADSPQSPAVAGWTCRMPPSAAASSAARLTATPHDCPVGSDLKVVLTFPDCWDGQTLDGARQTNAVYAVHGVCPESHPIRIPQLVVHVAYPTSSARGLSLSVGPHTQGSVDTEHADFMNGWDASRMSADTAACIDTHTRCGPTAGPLATPQGGTAPAGGSATGSAAASRGRGARQGT